MLNASEGAVVIENKSLLFFKVNNNSISKLKELKVPVRNDFHFHKGGILVGQNKKISVYDSSHQHVRDISVDGDAGYMAMRDDNIRWETGYTSSLMTN